MKRSHATLAFAGLLLAAACGGGGTALVPDFALLDVNPTSPTSATRVSPRDFLSMVAGIYFGSATWGYCRSQFGFLDQLQNELLAANPSTSIRLLGVDAIGSEIGNSAMCDGRDLPWLQDTIVDQVWNLWGASLDEVYILDRNGALAAVYDLATHDLADPANYDELKALLKSIAGE